jgi:hypothetical protein
VAIGRGDHDPPPLQALLWSGNIDRQVPEPLQDVRQRTGSGSRDMERHQDRCGQVRLKRLSERDQALHTPGGGSNNDDVAIANFFWNAGHDRDGSRAHDDLMFASLVNEWLQTASVSRAEPVVYSHPWERGVLGTV